VRLGYLDLTGQPLRQFEVRPGRKWMLEQDVFAALRCNREGTLTFRQWLKSIRGVKETHWFAADDLAPGLAWLRSNVWPRVVSRVRRLRRRRRNRVSPATS
jgi:D-aspartate ligase